MSTRVFHDLLLRVGSDGRFQVILTASMCLVLFMVQTNGLAGPYLFYQADYQCPQTIKNCHDYVCSLSPSQRSSYIPSDSKTMISRFGDYRCVTGGDPETVKIVMYSGGVICLLLGLLLIMCFTQRQILIMWTVIGICALTVIILSPSLVLTTICLFLLYGSRSLFLNVSIAYLMQFLTEDNRMISQIVMDMFFGLGTPLVGLMHYLITPWQLTLGLYHILPSLILLFCLLRFCTQTLRQMTIQNRKDKVLATLQQMADTNGVPCTIDEQEVEQITKGYHQNEANQQSLKIYFWDLFRYASLRFPTIVSIFMHFLISYQAIGSQLLLNDYASNIYLNGVVIGTSSLLSSVFCLFTIAKFPRKVAIVTIQVINIFLTAALFIWVPCVDSSSCSSTQKTIQTVGLFVFRWFSGVSYYFFYVGQSEFFPAQIRSQGLLLTGIASEVAIIVVPVIQASFQGMKVSVILTFAICSGLLVLTGLFFPQTFGTPPPQKIKELAEEQQQPRQLMLSSE